VKAGKYTPQGRGGSNQALVRWSKSSTVAQGPGSFVIGEKLSFIKRKQESLIINGGEMSRFYHDYYYLNSSFKNLK
jgi:hypothetical protein